MGVIYGKAGNIIYVKATHSLFPFFRTKEQLIKFGEYLKYKGAIPEIIEIPDEPIHIELSEDDFETLDKAKVTVVFNLTVVPNLHTSLEEIRKTGNIFEDKNPEKLLTNKLSSLFITLREYPLASILDNKNCKTVPSNDLSDGSVAEKESEKLTIILEEQVNSILNVYNFEVVKDTTIIKCVLPKIYDLSTSNPNHQAIIEYLQNYTEKEIELTKKQYEIQEKLDKLKTNYEIKKLN